MHEMSAHENLELCGINTLNLPLITRTEDASKQECDCWQDLMGIVPFPPVQLIQDEIKQLVRSQSSTWARSRAVPSQLPSTFPSLPSPMGMCSEASEEQESLVIQLRSSEGDSPPEASEVQQECAGSEASMNSGYGSLSTSELSPAQLGPSAGAGLHADAGSLQNKRELPAKEPEENRSLGRSDILVFPTGLEHKADEDHQRGKKPR